MTREQAIAYLAGYLDSRAGVITSTEVIYRSRTREHAECLKALIAQVTNVDIAKLRPVEDGEFKFHVVLAFDSNKQEVS